MAFDGPGVAFIDPVIAKDIDPKMIGKRSSQIGSELEELRSPGYPR